MGKASCHCCSLMPVFANIRSVQSWLLAQSTATAALHRSEGMAQNCNTGILVLLWSQPSRSQNILLFNPTNHTGKFSSCSKILCQWTWGFVVQVPAIPMRQWGQVQPSEIYIYTWKLSVILLFSSPETAPLPQPWETHAHTHRGTEEQSIDTLRQPLTPCRAPRILIISIIIELDKIHLTFRMLGSAGDAMPHFTSITTCSKVVVSNSIW